SLILTNHICILARVILGEISVTDVGLTGTASPAGCFSSWVEMFSMGRGQLIIEEQGVCCVETKKTWTDPFLKYLKKDMLPNDTTQAKKLIREASKYILVSEYLYRRGFSFPLLKCLDEDEFEYMIREVHEGIALASKVARAGYYLPTLKCDCIEYVKKCDKRQRINLGHYSQGHVVLMFIVFTDETDGKLGRRGGLSK
ncbi:hypothetical protein CR513_06235, partial [Mucuna pruriens]